MTRPRAALEALHTDLDWPSPAQVMAPEGVGANAIVRIAKQKIEAKLQRVLGSDAINVGLLVADPHADETPEVLAVVCEFTRVAPASAIRETHRLAWNFCRAPLLITVEAHQIRCWSCFVTPVASDEFDELALQHIQVPNVEGDPSSDTPLHKQPSRALHWLSLSSGEFIKAHRKYFNTGKRADRTLLANLKHLRQRLKTSSPPLSDDVAHDLIGRLIFIQFLFDRTAHTDQPFAAQAKLAELHKQGRLKKRHADLASLLRDYPDTYQFFKWLDERFNGDFFPHPKQPPEAHLLAWRQEESSVRPEHLQLIADFVGGNIDEEQYTLWRLYEFDVIPLEFVSCIYEDFIKDKDKLHGAHYTRVHLVDFVLDSVLPWHGDRWDLRVLDPACGSGAFLVRAFQRLIYRWRRAHDFSPIPPALLTRLLEEQIIGVDINAHATRVASFSLYLAMCDEIEPSVYWTSIRFPPLRGHSIFTQDLFKPMPSRLGEFIECRGKFDVVAGNSPWGKDTETPNIKAWAQDKWPEANKDVGTLFLAKAIELTVKGGHVAMIQSAGALLFQGRGNAPLFRKRLFSMVTVEEVVNFSLLRRNLFSNATSPACSISLRNVLPTGQPITYICPKLLGTGEDGFRISIDPLDVHHVYADEVNDPLTWTVLTAGGRRDLSLLRRLRKSYPALGALRSQSRQAKRVQHDRPARSADADIESAEKEFSVQEDLDFGIQERVPLLMQEGVIPKDNGPAHPTLKRRLFLDSPNFPPGEGWTIKLPESARIDVIRCVRNTQAEAFNWPQLLIKQNKPDSEEHFQARLIEGKKPSDGIVCSQSYITVSAPDSEAGRRRLKLICLVANSQLAAYYLLMSSARTSYRRELLATEIYNLPLPAVDCVDVDLQSMTIDEIDHTVMTLFGINEAERILIEDGLRYRYPELLQRQSELPSREVTRWTNKDGVEHDELVAYCETFVDVLNSVLRKGQCARATYYDISPLGPHRRLAAIHIDAAGQTQRVQHAAEPSSAALSILRQALSSADASSASPLLGGRVLTAFETALMGARHVPTLYLSKPDQRRYWSRSVALQDADALVTGTLANWPNLEPTTRAA